MSVCVLVRISPVTMMQINLSLSALYRREEHKHYSFHDLRTSQCVQYLSTSSCYPFLSQFSFSISFIKWSLSLYDIAFSSEYENNRSFIIKGCLSLCGDSIALKVGRISFIRKAKKQES